jgi:hypothetical protein
MQNFHNAAYREEEREMLPTLKVSRTPLYSPLRLFRPQRNYPRPR